jgi:hypothetical protein
MLCTVQVTHVRKRQNVICQVAEGGRKVTATKHPPPDQWWTKNRTMLKIGVSDVTGQNVTGKIVTEDVKSGSQCN